MTSSPINLWIKLLTKANGTEWQLLVFGGVPYPPLPNVRAVPATEAAVVSAYGLSQGLVLIRPDGYLALIASDQAEVTRYFERLQ